MPSSRLLVSDSIKSTHEAPRYEYSQQIKGTESDTDFANTGPAVPPAVKEVK